MGRRLKPTIGRAALVAALLVLSQPTVVRATATHVTLREDAVVTEVNRVRTEHGLPALQIDVRLVRAARGHSASMIASGTFAHGKFWTWIERQGVTSGDVGETLGWSAPVDGSVERIVAMWMESPTHRAIVLSRIYRTVGVGISTGAFMSRPDAIVVTADYLGPVT